MKFKTGQRFEAIAEGEYKALVVGIEPGEYIKKRKVLRFIFEIAEGHSKGARLNAFVNANYETFSSHTKLHKWHTIATGEELEDGEELDTDCFLNKVFNVKVQTSISRRTGNPFSNVKELLEVVREY